MIREAEICDANAIAQLAVKMWTSHTVQEIEHEFYEILANDESAVFLCILDAKAIGFAQCQLRHDYVEGTSSSPVGYLEGVFIEAEHRHNGYAWQLLSACEQWARERGCAEFASDCELDNLESLAFHLKSGFCEANRIICFTKPL